MSQSSLEALLQSESVASAIIDSAVLNAKIQLGTVLRASNIEVPTPDEWRRRLLAASALAFGDDERCQEAALQIATACLLSNSLDSVSRETARTSLWVGADEVLRRLGNRVSAEMAIEQGICPQIEAAQLSPAVRLHRLRHELMFEIRDGENGILSVNPFQRNLFDALSMNEWVSASAPTSAGKSFALSIWMAQRLTELPLGTMCVIVPTRALIHETESRLRKILLADRGLDVAVSSMPLAHSHASRIVYVFTQERLHLWLSRNPTHPGLDVLVIDEAHKIGDGSRGVLLQQAIDLVMRRTKRTRVVFLSPMTANPEVLLGDSPSQVSTAVADTPAVTVLQNLLWVTQVPRKPKQWRVDLVRDDQSYPLGEVLLANNPSSVRKRMTFLAHAMGDEIGGNVLYANRATDAETMCKQLYDLLGEDEESRDIEERDKLAELAEVAVHPKYLLRNFVRRGVAYHYGNMPLILRTAIEKMFTRGVIRYLVCTSTLLEGVNTACRSIFLRGPKKGIGIPMGEGDFWNLAGRSGRWGREFQGNVVCIDANDENVWGGGTAPSRRTKYLIERRTIKILQDEAPLLAFLENRAPVEEALKNRDLEATVAYLGSCLILGDDLSELPWSSEVSSSVVERVTELLREAIEESELSAQTLTQHPGICVYSMRRLLERFRDSPRDPEELAPVLPSSSDAVQVYGDIFRRINDTMCPEFGTGGRPYVMSRLSVEWMRGYPIARLVSESIKRAMKSNRKTSVQNQIRDTLSNIEKFPRFIAPRYVACYMDVLGDHYRHLGLDLAEAGLEDIATQFELGLGTRTQLVLSELGLSRTSVIATADLIASDDLERSDVISWLRDRQWATATLPALVKEEIDEVLSTYAAL